MIEKRDKTVVSRRSLSRSGAIGSCLGIILTVGCDLEVLTKSRFLDFDFNGSNVQISSGGVHHTLDITRYAAARGDFGYRVLFVNRRPGFIYAVLEVTGSSRGESGGACISGVEQNVIWLKLNRDLEPQEVKSVLVESCLQGIHTPNACAVAGNQLLVNFVREFLAAQGGGISMEKRECSLRYDDSDPDRGLSTTEHGPEAGRF